MPQKILDGHEIGIRIEKVRCHMISICDHEKAPPSCSPGAWPSVQEAVTEVEHVLGDRLLDTDVVPETPEQIAGEAERPTDSLGLQLAQSRSREEETVASIEGELHLELPHGGVVHGHVITAVEGGRFLDRQIIHHPGCPLGQREVHERRKVKEDSPIEAGVASEAEGRQRIFHGFPRESHDEVDESREVVVAQELHLLIEDVLVELFAKKHIAHVRIGGLDSHAKLMAARSSHQVQRLRRDMIDARVRGEPELLVQAEPPILVRELRQPFHIAEEALVVEEEIAEAVTAMGLPLVGRLPGRCFRATVSDERSGAFHARAHDG